MYHSVSKENEQKGQKNGADINVICAILFCSKYLVCVTTVFQKRLLRCYSPHTGAAVIVRFITLSKIVGGIICESAAGNGNGATAACGKPAVIETAHDVNDAVAIISGVTTVGCKQPAAPAATAIDGHIFESAHIIIASDEKCAITISVEDGIFNEDGVIIRIGELNASIACVGDILNGNIVAAAAECIFHQNSICIICNGIIAAVKCDV